ASARRDDEIEIADEPAAAERLRQAARDQEPARAALRRDEVDAGGGGQPARASGLELLDQASGLLGAPPGPRRARLGALAQPFDLAPHGIGERFLIGRLPAQELVPACQEFAVAAVGLEQPVGIDAIELEHPRRDVLEEVAVVADHEAGARTLG